MKTGSVKQVAAFGKLVGICNDLGASYNPSKASLTPTALTALLEQAQQNVEAVNSARATFILAVNTRQESFAGIPMLAARIVRAVSASESSIQNIRDVRMWKRKLLPKSTSKGADTKVTQVAGETPKDGRSSSRLDFDGRADTFANLIQVVQGMPSYNPNEQDLKLCALKAVLADLKNKSEAVAKAGNALANARMARNKVLLGEAGLVETGTAVKDYIRSIFGMNSEPSRELSKIQLAA